MAKSLTQSIALALFFSPLLSLHELKAADNAPATFTSLQLSVVDGGNCSLTEAHYRTDEVHDVMLHFQH